MNLSFAATGENGAWIHPTGALQGAHVVYLVKVGVFAKVMVMIDVKFCLSCNVSCMIFCSSWDAQKWTKPREWKWLELESRRCA